MPLSPPSRRSPCKMKTKYVLRGAEKAREPEKETRGGRAPQWQEGRKRQRRGLFRRSFATLTFSFFQSFSPSLPVYKDTMPAPAGGPKILNRAAATPATPAKAAPKILVKAAAKDVPSSAAATNGGGAAAAFGEGKRRKKAQWVSVPSLPLCPSSRRFECCCGDERTLRSRYRSRGKRRP